MEEEIKIVTEEIKDVPPPVVITQGVDEIKVVQSEDGTVNIKAEISTGDVITGPDKLTEEEPIEITATATVEPLELTAVIPTPLKPAPKLEKIVIIFSDKTGAAEIGIKAFNCDPHFFSAADLRAAIGGLPGFIKAAQESWKTLPVYPTAKSPAVTTPKPVGYGKPAASTPAAKPASSPVVSKTDPSKLMKSMF